MNGPGGKGWEGWDEEGVGREWGKKDGIGGGGEGWGGRRVG